MTISRRRFLRSAAAVSLGFSGLQCAPAPGVTAPTGARTGFGPLVDDPDGVTMQNGEWVKENLVPLVS